MIEHDEAEEPESTGISAGVSRRGLLAAGTVLGATAALGATTGAAAAATLITYTGYTPDNDENLKNPERGFYRQVEDGPGFHTLVEGWLWLHEYCSRELVWMGRDHPDTSPVLKKYASDLQERRKLGLKVVFRPRYDNPSGNTPSSCGLFHADTLERQLRHIDAVAKMFRENRDAIGVIQAGYLGRWGEWNTDKYPDSTAPLLYRNESRIAITERILFAYSGGNPGKLIQPVELRRPVFAKEVLDRNARANVGLYNDCFMTNPHDFGTYLNFTGSSSLGFLGSNANHNGSTQQQTVYWKDWAQKHSTTKSFGGETCYVVRKSGETGYGSERWRDCVNMRTEPAQLHVNYLNHDYAEEAIIGTPQQPVGDWVAKGCLPEIKRRLGYRFEVTRADYTQTVPAGQKFTVMIDVKNTGWARLHKPRRAQLFLRKVSTAWTVPFGYAATDTAGPTMNWAAGSTPRVTYTDVAPPTGKYSVHLAIFDPEAPVIWNQPEPRDPNQREEWRYHYAVKLASKRDGANLFRQTTGMNDLGIFITVQ
ncbi:DUF4832 domain-containing protein [Kocuria nitroreducens]|uniref:DUF4832 domain-containing protein n=1 Tax=Kocuria nitroreducens TaxID=3058914 RepID=UPI0036D8BDB8